MGLFDGLLDQLRQMRVQQDAQQAGQALFGTTKEGRKATGLTPNFLKQAAFGAGGGMGDFFAQAFAQLQDPRALNAQLGLIGQQVAGRARRARSTGRFRGSAVGEALASGIETGGQALEQQARLRDQAERMRMGMGLTQAFTGAVTSPLMQVLGISEGALQSQQALEEQRRQFDKSQPSTFDKVLGFAGSVLCWVAREVLQDDRWLAVREFMIHEAPPYLKHMYEQHGEELADRVHNDPGLRLELTPVFEEFARRGAKYLEE